MKPRLILGALLSGVAVIAAIALSGRQGRPAASVVKPGSEKSKSADNNETVRAFHSAPQSAKEARARPNVEAVKQTLASMRSKNALHDPNVKIEAAAQERAERLNNLVNQLRENPDTIAPLLEQLWAETDDELVGLIVEAIVQSSDKTGHKLPVEELLKHAKNNSSPARRAAALRILSRIPTLNSNTLESVAELARSDPEKGVKISAVSTLNSWMIFHRSQGENIAAEVVEVRDTTDDPMIRGISIQAVANQDLPLQGKLLDAMVTSLKEPVPMNRALAALGLARGATDETRSRVLQELSAAFERETESYVKRNMIGMIVLGGKTGAVDSLMKIHSTSTDPIVQQDAQDYLELIASGEADMEKIIGLKELRDDERGTTNHVPEEQFHAAN